MRVANLVYLLNREEPWVLVLPPWVKMWHWRSRDVAQDRLKWADFFDVDSMGKHVPVIELEDYIKSKVKITTKYITFACCIFSIIANLENYRKLRLGCKF